MGILCILFEFLIVGKTSCTCTYSHVWVIMMNLIYFVCYTVYILSFTQFGFAFGSIMLAFHSHQCNYVLDIDLINLWFRFKSSFCFHSNIAFPMMDGWCQFYYICIIRFTLSCIMSSIWFFFWIFIRYFWLFIPLFVNKLVRRWKF